MRKAGKSTFRAETRKYGGPFGDGGPEDGEKTKKFILADVSGGRSIKGLAALVEEAVSWLCG